MELKSELLHLYRSFDSYPMTIAALLKYMIIDDNDISQQSIDGLCNKILLTLGPERHELADTIINALKNIRTAVLQNEQSKQFIELQIDDLVRMQAISDYIKKSQES